MYEPCLHEFTRKAYGGGRSEVFREKFDSGFGWSERCDTPTGFPCACGGGHNPLNYADFNSMYAWAMLGPMPVDLDKVLTDGYMGTYGRMNRGELGFVRCTVHIPLDCYLPPLPYRLNGKLTFPVGTFTGTWTTEELSLLPQVGGEILKVEKSVWFKGRVLFDEYVKFWFDYRQSGDSANALIGKQYLTNLYGKFGQTPEREKLYFFPSDEELAEHVLIPLPNVPPSMGAFSETTYSAPPYIIPHIAAWITSRSRARLWRTMFDYLSQGYRIYYCDTDSIITDAPLTSSTELGRLKIECQVKRARFVAPKLYFLETLDKGGIVKAKGFSGGFGGKGLTEAEFNELVDHRTTVAIQRMTKLREGIRSGKRFPAKKHLRKGLREGILDEKRVHLEDGNTRPIDVTGM